MDTQLRGINGRKNKIPRDIVAVGSSTIVDQGFLDCCHL